MIENTLPVDLKRASKIKNSGAFENVLDSVTVATIIIMLVSVVLLYLTNIYFNLNLNWKDFGYQAIILYILTVTINFLARSITKRRGRKAEEHVKALESVVSNEKIIIETKLRGREREYCRKWELEELHDTRSRLLSSANIDINLFESELVKYSNRELKQKAAEYNLTEYQLKIIKKTRRIKQLHYDEKFLSSSDQHKNRVTPDNEINTRRYEKWHNIRYLITSALAVIVSVSMAIEVISEPTLATIVMCIIKILTIIISAIVGMLAGYKLTAESETAELKRKAVEQINFIAWCKENDGE